MQQRNTALDGIRGIAILMVVLFHATMTLGHHNWLVRQLLRVTQSGWLGVQVFFALSGFLITGILLRQKQRPLGDYLRTFYFRRALRILPLYVGVLLLLLLIPLLIPALRGPDYDRFLSIQGWLWLHAANLARELYGPATPALEFGWFEVTHFWTLAVEEHFYLVWPVLVFFLSKRGLVVLSVIVVALSAALNLGWLSDHPLLVATPKYLGGLVIGACAAILPSAFGFQLMAVAFLALVGVAVSLGVNSDTAWVVSPLAATITACTCVLVTTTQGRLSKALSVRWLRVFGTYSYGIYVYHYLLGPTFRTLDLRRFPGGYSLGAVCYVLMFLILPLLVAMASYRWFEEPFLRLKDRQQATPSLV